MNNIVNLKDGFITFNSNIDYSLSFSKCGIGYSNYNINSHERGSLVFLTNNNANTTNISLHSDIRMCIASDGNVGIGTNNPSQKLDILGNTNISRILKVGGIAQNEGEIKLQVYCAGSTNSANNLVAIFKHPNDSQGIGITYDSIIALGTSDTNATQPINIKSKGDASIFLNTNSTDRLTILGNGNVGIGTTNTNYKLDIQGFAAQTLRIMDTRATGDAIIALKETNDDNGFDMAYIGTTGDKFYIRGYNNSATPRVDFTIDRINSNVGIGMTDPKYKLDVAGTINASNILINGSIVTANNQQWITSSANVYTSNLLGNVGIGITNPSYKCHIKTITDNIASGLHLDADDTGSNPNKYALTIWPSLTGGQVGWKFRTQNSVSGGVNTPLEFTNTGSIRFKKDIWHSDSDGNARLYFNNAERTYIRGHGTTPIEFRNGDDATIATFSSTGNLNITGSELYVGPDSGSSRIFLGGGAAGDTGYNHSVIESRNYSSTENTELLLFKGNDIGSPDSADRIRLRAGAIVFDTYPGASVDRAASNIRMVINGSGNIGVGTLTPLSGNKFHVEGNTYLNGDTSINGSLVVNSNLIVHGETTRLNTDVYTTERLELINAGSSTSFILRQTASGNTNNILNVINSATSNVFNITSAGNIGIGTNNPNANLHLHGNAASQNVRISFTDNTSGVATTDGFCIGKDTLQVGYIYNTESNAISIGTHNTERIRILADGNVGIGTNNIAYKLHIKMDYANIASGLHLDASDASPPNQYALTIYPYVIGAGQVGWKFRTQSQTGGTNTPLTLNHAGNITMAGNVGIGTNAPQHLLSLHVNNTTDTGRITFTNNNTGTAYDKGFMIGLHSTKDVFIWNTENSAIQFGTSGEERMRILGTGNVGIGTTAPNSVLDIVRTSASGLTVDMLNTRFDNNWGLKVQQNYVGAGDIRYNLIHRYNAIDYNSLTFKGSNVGIGTTNPLSLLDINTTSYTGAILTLDAGIINATTQMPRSIGKPLMKLGKTSYSTTAGDYYGIGFGYSPLPTDFNCAEIGVLITSVSGAETGDIVFSTRPNTTNVAPTERMRITSDGNVGIGTTNPTSKLHITTTSSTNLLDFRNVDIFGIYATSLGIGSRGNTLDFLARDYNNGNGVATRNILSLRPEGNVGIGTTNPGYKLDIQGSDAQTLRILDTRTAGDAIVALKEFNDNNGFDMAYIGSTDDRFYIRGYNNSSTPRVDLAIDRITSNVGIGMTDPKYKLDVAGTINASNILINGSIISASSSQWITTGTKIYNNNTGNVGIGTTNPNHILHLHKNATTQDVRIALTDNTSTASGTRGLHLIKYSDNSSYLWNYESTSLTIATADTERIVILANGNVGIGTTNPGYKLDIQGGAVQTLRILDTRTAGDAIVALKELNDNNGFDMAYIGSTDDRFYIRGYNNSATPRVDLAIDRITSNVGIGMTNPKYKLDVAGTINASNILINGSIISASSSQWITSGTNIYANNLLGNVGIGTNNPSAYTLQVNGTIGASGNITASYSDERLKNITEYVRDVLPILSKINVFKYNCNDLAASYGYDKNKKEIGLSAQEVQKYYPEVVSIAPFDSEYDEEKKNITSKSSKNYLTLDYERLVPILLQGIKDLNNKVVEMEENEIHMKNELNNIKSRLDKLELI
jgi:hypothetical protein